MQIKGLLTNKGMYTGQVTMGRLAPNDERPTAHSNLCAMESPRWHPLLQADPLYLYLQCKVAALFSSQRSVPAYASEKCHHSFPFRQTFPPYSTTSVGQCRELRGRTMIVVSSLSPFLSSPVQVKTPSLRFERNLRRIPCPGVNCIGWPPGLMDVEAGRYALSDAKSAFHAAPYAMTHVHTTDQLYSHAFIPVLI